VGLTATWLAASVLLDRYGRGRREPAGRWDAVIVAGCRVAADGTPSAALAARVSRAVDLVQRGVAPRLVTTGGAGRAGPPEAVAAARLAARLGVPHEAIVVEDRSTSTEENARFARALVDAESVVVVTDSYHVLRCERVFGRYFARVVGVGSLSPPGARAAGALREVAALGWYAAAGRLRRR
jgi:uncharacterized SAM-binding protein YcdF (DUF218 family)